MNHDSDGGLGRPVVVEHSAIAAQSGDAFDQRRGNRLAAEHQGARQCRLFAVEQRREVRRHDLQAIDLMLAHERGEQRAVLHLLIAGDMQGRAKE